MISKKIKRILVFTFLVIMAVLFVAPVVIVIMNSFKSNQGISTNVFALPTNITFVGFDNFATDSLNTGLVTGFPAKVLKYKAFSYL